MKRTLPESLPIQSPSELGAVAPPLNASSPVVARTAPRLSNRNPTTERPLPAVFSTVPVFLNVGCAPTQL